MKKGIIAFLVTIGISTVYIMIAASGLYGDLFDNKSLSSEAEFETSKNRSYLTLDENLEVYEDYSVYWDFEYNVRKSLTIEVENLSINDFEIFVFTEENYLLYRDNPEDKEIFGFSINIPGKYSTDKSYNLESGKYYVVIDNTDYGYVLPPTNGSDDMIACVITIYFQ